MSSLNSLAALLTRTVELFRDDAAREDQKVQFRALLTRLNDMPVTLRVADRAIHVNDEAIEGAVIASLLDRLSLHGVEEIRIPKVPPPSHVFGLLRALAAPPSDEDVAARLRGLGADTISVRVAAAIVTSDIAPPASPASPDGGKGRSPTPPAGVALPPALQRPEGAAPTAVPQTPEEAIALLEQDPRAANVGDLLAVLTGFLDEAARSRRTEGALPILTAVVRCEELASDASARRQYAIALKRMFSKGLLEGLAQLVTIPQYQPDALVALRRAGADGVEVLLDLLVVAPTVPERQAIFGALREMKEGTDQVVLMLDHPQWFVVRNVAELLGELGMEDAVPALAKLLDHDDERVRKAVALALAKIGSGPASEPLRRALHDKAPGVRMQVALGVGGRKSSSLAMPLVVAMEEEQDPEVERELIMALGRIGSSDAVQALIKCAKPAGRLFGRKPSALRVAAVEALRIAATPAAVGMLQGLADDSDKLVRQAAQEALLDLKR
jgi:hypothetical protein